MASILDLPAELIISIASHLNTAELGPLRRSCKQLEQHLFETFATEFFTKRQLMIEHVSLQALVDISNHPTLSERLVHCLISTDMFEHLHRSDVQYSADNISRESLLRTGQARDMLAEAFSKLKNLQIVGLRDFNSKGRVREGGSEALWRSYGWSTKADTTTSPVMGSDRNPSTLFSLIIYALGTARAFPPEIQVILRNRETLTPHAFKVNPLNAPVILRLKTLFLSLHTDNSSTITRSSACEAPIKRFLHAAADLETLRLNFDARYSAVSTLLDWLGTPSDPTQLEFDDPNLFDIPPAPLCNLTTLELGGANVSGAHLIRTISRFHLKGFSLWRMTLSDRDRAQLKFDHWAEFLSNLSEALRDCDSIQSITIGLLAQVREYLPQGTAFEKVQICPEGTVDKSKLKEEGLPAEARYRARYGLTASQWLRSLSKRIYVRSIHAPPPLPDSDSEETEPGEDDDEEDDEDGSEDEDED